MVITVPLLPPRELSPNVKYNRFGKKRIMQEWQIAVAWYVKATILEDTSPFDSYQKAELTIQHIIKDRRSIMDEDNAIAMNKATIDVLKLMHPKKNPYGIGVLLDDRPECLKLNPVIFTVDKERSPATIITVKEVL